MKWFGRKFARVCEDAPEVPVPIGATCAYCEEPILEKDQGFMIPHSSALSDADELAEHHECFMRQIVGSVGHQRGTCHCKGREDHSEDGLTRREAAIQARAYFEERFPNRTILR